MSLRICLICHIGRISLVATHMFSLTTLASLLVQLKCGRTGFSAVSLCFENLFSKSDN